MRIADYVFQIAPKALPYALARRRWIRPPKPLTLTFSVTAACQSRCLTCRIGSVYLANPEIARQNLTLEEIEETFRSLGRLYFLNISGGEPFMRADLPEIVRLACIHLRPRLIHIPTNALAPRFIERSTRQILEHMDRYLPPSVPISVKPSIDGIGQKHDEIRGTKGNFARLERTIDLLLALQSEHPRLHVDLGTVVSNYNLDDLEEIEDWVHARGVQSYRHEIAEQRSEFHNLGDPITPQPDAYAAIIHRFTEKIRLNIEGKSPLTATTEAVRLVYYELAAEILRQGKQITPCYGGISNIHLNYDGEVWPCCVLGSHQAMGRVRDYNYDLPLLLRSAQAQSARKHIADGKCACPLANQWLVNVLLTPRHMLKAIYNLVVVFPRARARKSPKAGG
jgi:MoaA/NifB/PqqE/SkfB family radical SAM enzyme